MGVWTRRGPACGCLVVPTRRPPSSAALGISRTRGQEQPPAGDPKIPTASLVPAQGTTRTTLPYSQTLSPCHHRARLWDLSPPPLVTPCTAAGLLRIHPKTQLLAVGDGVGGICPLLQLGPEVPRLGPPKFWALEDSN